MESSPWQPPWSRGGLLAGRLAPPRRSRARFTLHPKPLHPPLHRSVSELPRWVWGGRRGLSPPSDGAGCPGRPLRLHGARHSRRRPSGGGGIKNNTTFDPTLPSRKRIFPHYKDLVSRREATSQTRRGSQRLTELFHRSDEETEAQGHTAIEDRGWGTGQDDEKPIAGGRGLAPDTSSSRREPARSLEKTVITPGQR